MTETDKRQMHAYRLSKDGQTIRTIAGTMGIRMTTARMYVSRGKALYAAKAARARQGKAAMPTAQPVMSHNSDIVKCVRELRRLNPADRELVLALANDG